MTPLLIGLLVTLSVLAGAFLLGRHLLKTTKKEWIGYLGIFLIGLPFSWTLFYGASSGGGAILPVPDLVAIIALVAGEFHSGSYSAVGSMPPPFIMTGISTFIAFLICRKHRPDLFRNAK